jgi:hypothetical protein
MAMVRFQKIMTWFTTIFLIRLFVTLEQHVSLAVDRHPDSNTHDDTTTSTETTQNVTDPTTCSSPLSSQNSSNKDSCHTSILEHVPSITLHKYVHHAIHMFDCVQKHTYRMLCPLPHIF